MAHRLQRDPFYEYIIQVKRESFEFKKDDGIAMGDIDIEKGQQMNATANDMLPKFMFR